MDANKPGLFDLPDRERPGTANRPLRGRNRQRWAFTVTAEVTVIDAGALHEAVAQAAGSAVPIRLRADPDVEDTEPGSCDVAPASNALDVLGLADLSYRRHGGAAGGWRLQGPLAGQRGGGGVR